MNLGAHMSIAGGVELALERGLSIGCRAVQLFTKNNNRWSGPPIAPEEAERFRVLAREFPPGFLVSHTAYLINLGSPKEEVLEKSLAAMRDELERAETLGLAGVVLHPGSHLGEGEEWGLKRIAASLDLVHGETAGFRTLTLLENTAGQGSNLGYRFEQLAAIMGRVRRPERIGVCFDTCHAFAAGYPIRERKGYLQTFRDFDRIVGLDRLRAIHLNDSVGPLGGRKDRHAPIGEGEIGREGFAHFVNERRFRKIPMILETPKSEDLHEDVENLRVLRSLRKKK
ncbi:MAG: deoxyribonuclease IV [Candidatus Eisenbacteria bacterium]|nr:deoxyribonuclease IV [Candidatus Eisenbacteria bacterium]